LNILLELLKFHVIRKSVEVVAYFREDLVCLPEQLLFFRVQGDFVGFFVVQEGLGV
jgi:hypothetical protein